jgi:hypothetical protein
MINPHTGKESRGCFPSCLSHSFPLSSLYHSPVSHSLCKTDSRPTTAHCVQSDSRISTMAKTKRAAPRLAGVGLPKQEGKAREEYNRLMIVMTPPPATTTKQPRVANERNEGTILQDDKGKITYTPIDSKTDNTAGVLTDTRSDEDGAEEEAVGVGDEHNQQGKKKKSSKAKAKRWTRLKTKGPSKVKPPNRELHIPLFVAEIFRTDGRRCSIQPNRETARAR